jgi:hypothetical protein
MGSALACVRKVVQQRSRILSGYTQAPLVAKYANVAQYVVYQEANPGISGGSTFAAGIGRGDRPPGRTSSPIDVLPTAVFAARDPEFDRFRCTAQSSGSAHWPFEIDVRGSRIDDILTLLLRLLLLM